MAKSGSRRDMVKVVLSHLHCVCVGIWDFILHFMSFGSVASL